MGRRANVLDLPDNLTQVEVTDYKKKLISTIREYMKSNGISYLLVSQATGISYPTVKRILDIGRDDVAQDTNYDFQFSYIKKIVDYLELPDTIFDNGEVPEEHASQPAEQDLSFLKKLDSAIPQNQYTARILTLFPFLTDEQKKVTLDLIYSYFDKSELQSCASNWQRNPVPYTSR